MSTHKSVKTVRRRKARKKLWRKPNPGSARPRALWVPNKAGFRYEKGRQVPR